MLGSREEERLSRIKIHPEKKGLGKVHDKRVCQVEKQNVKKKIFYPCMRPASRGEVFCPYTSGRTQLVYYICTTLLDLLPNPPPHIDGGRCLYSYLWNVCTPPRLSLCTGLVLVRTVESPSFGP